MQNSITVLTPTDWTDYELIDSGNGAKLERFGTYIIARPDPRAIWQRKAPAGVWENAQATFVRGTNDDGHWDIKRAPP
ncbi:MAG: class I SAM-dependent rRNA methyltransferase, partial [Patescibacteria group bacterium]